MNPYAPPQTPGEPLREKRWPKRWGFVLALAVLASGTLSGMGGYTLGYLHGYRWGSDDRVNSYPDSDLNRRAVPSLNSPGKPLAWLDR